MIRIIIEGSSNTDRGNLRKGFHKLFSKALKSEFPFSIWMAGGKERAVGAFVDVKDKTRGKYLLIDLDASEEQRHDELKRLKLEGHQDKVFFMIQEMEAWFFSQPDKLQEHFNDSVLLLPLQAPKIIKNPKSKLKDCTTSCRKKYHEIEDGTALLGKLDPEKLAADFPEDFGRLINIFKSITQ